MGISHYVLQCTDLISRLFCVSHSYTVFSTGNLKFSIYFSENHSYNMFHNVHFTLCSTLCRPYFLGCSVHSTHIQCSSHCISHLLCFSLQIMNILCFTMCISHYVLKCAVWFSMCFSTTHSYIVFFNVHFSFSIFQCNSLTYCVL